MTRMSQLFLGDTGYSFLRGIESICLMHMDKIMDKIG